MHFVTCAPVVCVGLVLNPSPFRFIPISHSLMTALSSNLTYLAALAEKAQKRDDVRLFPSRVFLIVSGVLIALRKISRLVK